MKSSLDQDTFERGFRQLFGYEKAGEEYLRIWNRLVLFFGHQSDAEGLADEVMDRMIWKAAEEVGIDGNVRPYALAIARFVRMEHLKKAALLAPYDRIRLERLKQEDTSEREILLQVLEECLEELAPDKRELIVKYYVADNGRMKIKQREKLAAELGVSLQSLRVRTLRIRRDLAKMIEHKLKLIENSRIT